MVPITRESSRYLEPRSHALKRKIRGGDTEYGRYRNRFQKRSELTRASGPGAPPGPAIVTLHRGACRPGARLVHADCVKPGQAICTRRVIWPLASQYVCLPASSGSFGAGWTLPSVSVARDVTMCSPEAGVPQRRRADHRVVGGDDPALGDPERAAAASRPPRQEDERGHGQQQHGQEQLGAHASPFSRTAASRSSTTPMAIRSTVWSAPAVRTRSVCRPISRCVLLPARRRASVSAVTGRRQRWRNHACGQKA
jgi:hypothetical protein